ncbi:MAG: F0F1 ATP synthase subunit A [Treponema sp.]|nr:F0F1 ATP synthase subunit A [Treponema sp.]
MDIGERLNEALKFHTVFTVKFPGFEIPVSETVVISWVVMAALILGALAFTRGLKTVPKGPQALLEGGVEFLNNFARNYFGRRAEAFAPYIGTIFLFLIFANVIPSLSPVSFNLAGRTFTAPFEIKPPARDINFAAALAVMSILLVLFAGLKARGLKGWAKNLLHPVPLMLPFNLLEYIIRPASMCLRLFGNILGGFIIMVLIGSAAPFIVPPVFSLYFDFLDGIIQALVFTFLTVLFLSEAVET